MEHFTVSWEILKRPWRDLHNLFWELGWHINDETETNLKYSSKHVFSSPTISGSQDKNDKKSCLRIFNTTLFTNTLDDFIMPD